MNENKTNRTMDLSLGKNNNNLSSDPNFTPVVVYDNALLHKQILQENEGKAGIYRWTRLETGESYVGSSVNLSRRFRYYFSLNYLKECKGSSHINRSLLKYGYSSFSLEILEYCPVSEVLQREDYFFKLFKPEYNLCKKAGNRSGMKHSEKTKTLLRAPKSEETKAKMSASKMGNPNGKNQPAAIKIKVTDIELNTKTIYDSIREAARALNIPQAPISRYFTNKQKTPYKKRYL